MTSYDVFISYRREGGAAEARLIQSALQARNVRAYLDVTELGRGYFDDALLRGIEQTPNFVVILSPHALDRSESDEDWLRKEIAHALKCERNVVPLLMPGFQFPPKLPRDLKNLPRHQGMDYSHLYFDAMMQKLLATLDLSTSDRERDQTEPAARRKLLEMHRQEPAGAPGDDTLRRNPQPGIPRWSGLFRIGASDAAAGPGQAEHVASWSLLLVAFAFLATASGRGAPGTIAAGAAFLGFAVWTRRRASQVAMTALVVSALTALGMFGAALAHRFDTGRVSFAWYAACAAAALWRATGNAGASNALPTVTPIESGSALAVQGDGTPFGTRFGDLIGVGGRVDIPRLRLFIVARLIGGLAYWWAVQANQGMFSNFRMNYLWIIWVSAALPLAFALTFRWLRNPLRAIFAAAVIASFVDPAFYQSGFAMSTVTANLVGSLLFAAAIEDVDDVRIAAWLGSASASLGGMLVGLLWGGQEGGWNQAGPNLYCSTLLAAVFTVVFIGGMQLTEQSKR